VSYLLDTNVCVAIMNNSSLSVRETFRDRLLGGEPMFLSTVVLCELCYGVLKSSLRYENRQRLREFMSPSMEILEFTQDDAMAAAEIRSALEGTKQPIGPYDTLIAGQAKARGLTVVTANVRESMA
jgi:tRNA(fMet)-specific endonuclease VapC